MDYKLLIGIMIIILVLFYIVKMFVIGLVTIGVLGLLYVGYNKYYKNPTPEVTTKSQVTTTTSKK